MYLRSGILAWAFLAFSFMARADIAPGRDYEVLNPPQPTDSPAKIEVIEFFSYACPHCNEFHPLVGQWSAQLPQDVAFKLVPATFGREVWGNLAKAYYVLESTGNVAKLHGALFDAIHKHGLPLVDESTITAWAVRQGIDAAKFAAAYRSFSVDTKANEADAMAQRYRIEGVPTLMVDGRYRVIGRNYPDMLRIADELIAKVRAEKAAKPN